MAVDINGFEDVSKERKSKVWIMVLKMLVKRGNLKFGLACSFLRKGISIV